MKVETKQKQRIPSAKQTIKSENKEYKEITNKTNKTVKTTGPEFEKVTKNSKFTNRTTVPKEVQDESIKGMNIRLSKLKLDKKLPELKKKLEDKKKILAKETKEKDALSNYISKLENDIDRIAKKATDPSFDSNALKSKKSTMDKKTSNRNTSDSRTTNNNKNIDPSNICRKTRKPPKVEEDDGKPRMNIKMKGGVMISMKGEDKGNVIKKKIDVMKFLNKIYMENADLKTFTGQVFNLSKNYEEISSILGESLTGFEDVAKSTENQELIDSVQQRIEQLREKIEKTFVEQQNDYNTKMEKKENDLKLLQTAHDNLLREYEEKKKLDAEGQKIIGGLKAQIQNLEMKRDRLKKQKEEKEKEEAEEGNKEE